MFRVRYAAAFLAGTFLSPSSSPHFHPRKKRTPYLVYLTSHPLKLVFRWKYLKLVFPWMFLASQIPYLALSLMLQSPWKFQMTSLRLLRRRAT